MIQDMWESLNNWIGGFPLYGKAFIWLMVILLVLFVIYLLVSLLFTPFMWLYNRLTDKNTSNVPSEKDVLLGELTEKIKGNGIGEVMESGNGGGRSSHPARLFDEEEVAAEELYPVGTKVLIIDFDEKGIALVVRNQNFI